MKHFLLLALFTPLFPFTSAQRFTIDFSNGPLPSPSSPGAPLPTDADGKPISPGLAAFVARRDAARAPKQPHWSDEYVVSCEEFSDFEGEIYPLPSLDPADLDPGIAWAAKDIDEFFTGEYPGGITANEEGMRLVRADWDALNVKVRKWVEGHADQRTFLVKDGVVFFAPASVLQFLPLFVGEDGKCRRSLDRLEAFGQDAGGVRVAGGIFGKLELGYSVSLRLKVEVMIRKDRDGGGKDKIRVLNMLLEIL